MRNPVVPIRVSPSFLSYLIMTLLGALGRVGEISARWPIQVIVAFSLLSALGYLSLANINVNTFTSPLSRAFVVDAPDSWTPTVTSAATKFDAGHRFVGAPLQFSGINEVAKRQVLEVLFPGKSALPTSVLILEKDFLQWVSKARHLDACRLKMSFSWVVWLKWCSHRLYDLVKETPGFDLLVVGAAYLAMNYSFLNLHKQFRTLGSRNYLFVAALVSSTLSFLVAYPLCSQMGYKVPLRSLAQGIPFFVLVVGFDTKVSLTREAVKILSDRESRNKEPSEIIATTLELRGFRILRDFTLEFGFLCLIGLLRIPAISAFAVLGASIMLMDAIFLVTFFAANLSIKLTMIKAERNQAARRALEEDGVSHEAAEQYADRVANVKGDNWLALGPFRAMVVVLGVVVNWLQLINFPVSPFFNLTDLWDEPEIAGFAAIVPSHSVVTVLPTLRFERQAPFLTKLNTYLSNDPMIPRIALFAFVCSLILNIYLFRIVTSQAEVQVVEKKIPILVERKPEVSQELTQCPDPVDVPKETVRSLEDCAAIMRGGFTADLNNEEVIALGVSGKIPLYALEKQLKDTTRAVVVRRAIVSRLSRTKTLEQSMLPWKNYDYDRVLGACCENVIGYLPLPIGVAGPIVIDGVETFLPLATTEGVLVASTTRGCKAINGGGGVATEILQDGMTRGPCITFGSLQNAARAKRWLDSEDGKREMKKHFDSTSRFARLTTISTALAGTLLFIRFRAQTGDAMGMNMISKGVEKALTYMNTLYEDMSVVSISGNYCTDKKASAINWIEGRGKSVVAEAIVPGHLVESVLKTTVEELVELNQAKNLVGSALAGTLGGFNAQAANLVAAVFIATGQDPAQVVEGSNCMTLMNNLDGDLQISVSMPSLEVGTIGGGTILEPQAAVLEMLGVKGPHSTTPGENSRQLARICASAVLAAELSLCAALAAGHLVKSHMAHNRSKAPTPALSTTK